MCAWHLLAKMNSSTEAHGEVNIIDYEVTVPLPCDLQKAFLCLCSQEGLLDFKNEEYVVFYLLSGQGPASPIIQLLWSFCQ